MQASVEDWEAQNKYESKHEQNDEVKREGRYENGKELEGKNGKGEELRSKGKGKAKEGGDENYGGGEGNEVDEGVDE